MRNIGANHESIAECFIAITDLKGGILCRLSSRQAVTSFVCAGSQTSLSCLPAEMTENRSERERGKERTEIPASRLLFAQHVYLIYLAYTCPRLAEVFSSPSWPRSGERHPIHSALNF